MSHGASEHAENITLRKSATHGRRGEIIWTVAKTSFISANLEIATPARIIRAKIARCRQEVLCETYSMELTFANHSFFTTRILLAIDVANLMCDFDFISLHSTIIYSNYFSLCNHSCKYQTFLFSLSILSFKSQVNMFLLYRTNTFFYIFTYSSVQACTTRGRVGHFDDIVWRCAIDSDLHARINRECE